MGRRRNGQDGERPEPATPSVTIGGNVSAETAHKHYRLIAAAETELKSKQQALKTAWDAAESDGISKAPFKAAMKRMKDDTAAADAYLSQFQQYTTQLGLFDRIAEWKQGEENEANSASVDAAERELADA